MKYLYVLAIVILSLAVMMACSKKQEDVDQLEQEMMTPEQPADTVTEDTVSPVAMDAAAVPAEEAPAYIPTTDEGEGFAIQIASCESLVYAEYLVETYTGRGYEPYISEYNHEGQLYYRVRISGFETLSDAKAVRDELVDRFSVKCWIDQL